MLAWLKRKTQPPAPPEKRKPADVSELVQRADAAREAHERKSAIALYESALDLAPADLYVLYWLAVLQREAGDLTAAQRYCDLGLAIDPNQIGLLLTLGSIASAVSDPTYALHVYERIASIDSEVPGIDALLADQYCFLGRTKEGIA